MATENKRIDFIDVSKALGIIAVMMSHGIGFPFGTGYYFCASFIPLFFVLSGYTFTPGRTFGENVKRKISRIGIAYFFYSGVLLLLSVGVKIVLREEVTLSYVENAIGGIFYSSSNLYYPHTKVPNINFFIIQNGPLWFLTSFMVASVLFYAVARFLNCRKGFAVTFLLGVGVTIAFRFLPIRLPWSMDTAFAGMSFMIFGYYIRWEGIFDTLSKWYISLLILASYVGLCIANPGIAMSVREYGPYGVFSILVFFLIGMLGALSYMIIGKLISHIPVLKEGLVYVGKRTLTLLAFHVFIFLFVDTILDKAGISYQGGALCVGMGVLKILLAIGICSFGSYIWTFMKTRFSSFTKGL